MNSRKTWSRFPSLQRTAAAAACTLGVVMVMPEARAATTWVVSFTIEDSYDINGNRTNAVRGDLSASTRTRPTRHRCSRSRTRTSG